MRILSNVGDEWAAPPEHDRRTIAFSIWARIDALGVFVVDSEAITAVPRDIIQYDIP